MKRLLALLLVASTALAGYSTSSLGQSTATSVDLASYSGEELYTNIIFGYGRAGTLVPTVSHYIDRSIKVSPVQRKRVEDVIADIKASDPKFFSQFARDVQSGDHMVIRAALERAIITTAVTTARQPRDQIRSIDPAVDIETFIYAIFVLLAFFIDFTPLQPRADNDLVLDALTDDLAALSTR
jgi:SdpC family antimicrobial peptide